MAHDNITDFDLPINSTINGNMILHEGNHNDRDYPHQNYIEKTPFRNFVTGTTNKNKYVKVATISYIMNNNVSLFYKFKFIELNYQAEHTLDIIVKYDTNSTRLYHTGSNKVVFYGIQSTAVVGSNTIYTMDIYAKPTEDYTYFFFRVDLCRGLNYFSGYPDSYAYRSIKLYNNEVYVDSITPNVNESVRERPVVRTTSNSVLTNVLASATYSLTLTVNGITQNCVLSIVPNVQIPVEFTFNAMITAANTIVIVFRNNSASANDIPACTWNIEYRSLV